MGVVGVAEGYASFGTDGGKYHDAPSQLALIVYEQVIKATG